MSVLNINCPIYFLKTVMNATLSQRKFIYLSVKCMLIKFLFFRHRDSRGNLFQWVWQWLDSAIFTKPLLSLINKKKNKLFLSHLHQKKNLNTKIFEKQKLHYCLKSHSIISPIIWKHFINLSSAHDESFYGSPANDEISAAVDRLKMQYYVFINIEK